MSVERKVIDELNTILVSIRRAEQNIIGLDAEDKLETVKKLVAFEEEVKGFKDGIKMPELVITKDTLLGDLCDERMLSIRAYNCLKRGGCNTLGDVAKHTSDEIKAMRNMGIRAHEEIMALLDKYSKELGPVK